MVYYVSDLFFGDNDVARRRHYSTYDEMSNIIVSNWNKIVCDTDTVYILGGVGDFSFLKSLNGEKILILSKSEQEHMMKYVSGISTTRDSEYDAEMYSWYLKSEYGISNVCYSGRLIHKNYSGRLVRMLTDIPDDSSTVTIFGGINNEYQRLFKNGVNSNIFMNGMYPISEVEVEELIKHIDDLI